MRRIIVLMLVMILVATAVVADETHVYKLENGKWVRLTPDKVGEGIPITNAEYAVNTYRFITIGKQNVVTKVVDRVKGSEKQIELAPISVTEQGYLAYVQPSGAASPTPAANQPATTNAPGVDISVKIPSATAEAPVNGWLAEAPATDDQQNALNALAEQQRTAKLAAIQDIIKGAQSASAPTVPPPAPKPILARGYTLTQDKTTGKWTATPPAQNGPDGKPIPPKPIALPGDVTDPKVAAEYVGAIKNGLVTVDSDGNAKLADGVTYGAGTFNTNDNKQVTFDDNGFVKEISGGKHVEFLNRGSIGSLGTSKVIIEDGPEHDVVQGGYVQVAEKPGLYVGPDGNFYQYNALAGSMMIDETEHKDVPAATVDALQKFSRDLNSEGYAPELAGMQKPKGVAGFVGNINDFLKQEYPGLAGLGGDLLGLIGGDAYDQWKSDVDKAFCDTVILGGKSCWVSAICGQSPETAGGDGVLVNQQFGNQTETMRFIAHVEGERSQAANSINGSVQVSQWLYKITYAIRNPYRKEKNGFQLRFFYEGGSYDWFTGFQAFNKGAYIQAIGPGAIVAYSERTYTKVCLVFENTVEINGEATRQVCNNIAGYAGNATAPYKPSVNATTTPGGAATGTPQQAGAGF